MPCTTISSHPFRWFVSAAILFIAAAIAPLASGLEYSFRNIAGSEIIPMAMTVAPTIPVLAGGEASERFEWLVLAPDGGSF